jgi:hypothetical protein
MVADRELLYVVSGLGRLYRHFRDGLLRPPPRDLGIGILSGVDLSPDMKWLGLADGSLREVWLGCNVVDAPAQPSSWASPMSSPSGPRM